MRRDFNQTRQNKNRRDRAKQGTRRESREVIVLPESEVGETEIDRERQSGSKQPDDSGSVCSL